MVMEAGGSPAVPQGITGAPGLMVPAFFRVALLRPWIRLTRIWVAQALRRLGLLLIWAGLQGLMVLCQRNLLHLPCDNTPNSQKIVAIGANCTVSWLPPDIDSSSIHCCPDKHDEHLL